MSITQQLQKLHGDSPLVELFILDCTPLGGSVYRFTPHFAEGGSIQFDSHTYYSMPIKSEGWEVTSTGNQPRPTLTISNVSQALLAPVIALGDLVGAKVTRYRTFEKFLDGKPAANPNAFIAPDIFVIEQKVSHDKEAISWQLSSVMDRFGIRIPRRQVTKDYFPGVGRQRGAW